MRVGFLMSPQGGSPLLVGLDRGLVALGHQVIHYYGSEAVLCDLLVVPNQTAHLPYTYPPFPEKVHCPLVFLDNAEYGWWTHDDSHAPRLYNAFTEEAMAKNENKKVQQTRLRQFLEGRSFPYFLREMYCAWNYPACYHPIDYPLYLYSECPKEPDLAEYLSRPMDLYLAWGSSHPFRPRLVQAIREQGDRFRQEIYETHGLLPRLPQKEYFARLEQSRMSLSYHGYGSGSFRVTETVVRTLLLQNRPCVLQRQPLVDGVTCVYYDVRGTGTDFHWTDLISKMEWVRDHPEAAFEIYRAGREHCMQHHSETAVARYVLEVVAGHDYSAPTSLAW